jgi:hypothetical protein
MYAPQKAGRGFVGQKIDNRRIDRGKKVMDMKVLVKYCWELLSLLR